MLAWIVGLLALLVALPAIADPTYNVSFMVRRADTGGAVVGAHLEIHEEGYRSRHWTADTGAAGSVTVPIDVNLSNYYYADVHAPGLQDRHVTFYLEQRRLGQPYGQVLNLRVPNIVLSRITGIEVRVHVLADDDKLPVGGAAVKFRSSDNVVTEATDEAGDATLYVSEGAYEVSVTHSNFEPASDTQTLNRYGENLSLRYVLHRKPRPPGVGDYHVRATVFGRSPTGQFVRLRGARVSEPGGFSATTDGDGVADLALHAAFGESVDITASAEGFQDQSQQVTLEAQSSVSASIARSQQASITFRLQPRMSNLVVLTILALDADTNQPVVKGGQVRIRAIGADAGPGGAAPIDASGRATFKLNVHTQAARTNGLRADVSSPGYEDRSSDIAPELLQASDQPRVFTVYLSRPKAAPEDLSVEVRPGQWTPSGLTLQPGETIQVQVTGKLGWPGQPAYISPDGGQISGGLQGYVATIKIGDGAPQEVGAGPVLITAQAGGPLMLGIPRCMSCITNHGFEAVAWGDAVPDGTMTFSIKTAR